MAERPFDPRHADLRPSGSSGLVFGVAGTVAMLLNLTYLARKRLGAIAWLGSLRAWMRFHILTGVLGAALILLHTAFAPSSALGRLLMIFQPKAPLLAGLAAIAVIAAFLAFRQPMPGPLAAPHDQIQTLSSLSGCAQCHHKDGLDSGSRPSLGRWRNSLDPGHPCLDRFPFDPSPPKRGLRHLSSGRPFLRYKISRSHRHRL